MSIARHRVPNGGQMIMRRHFFFLYQRCLTWNENRYFTLQVDVTGFYCLKCTSPFNPCPVHHSSPSSSHSSFISLGITHGAVTVAGGVENSDLHSYFWAGSATKRIEENPYFSAARFISADCIGGGSLQEPVTGWCPAGWHVPFLNIRFMINLLLLFLWKADISYLWYKTRYVNHCYSFRLKLPYTFISQRKGYRSGRLLFTKFVIAAIN